MLVIEKLKKEASSHQSYEIFIRDQSGYFTVSCICFYLKRF